MGSDEELMQQFQGGSREAFEAIFSHFRVPLYAFFFRRLRHRSRADDLTQETFLALIRNARDWEPQSSLRAYLFGIAFRILAGERRKEAKEETGTLFESGYVTRPETGIAVRLALDKLEPDEREILMLREYEQLSYLEISDVLGIPLNTVRSRLFRARVAMRDILQPAKREAWN